VITDFASEVRTADRRCEVYKHRGQNACDRVIRYYSTTVHCKHDDYSTGTGHANGLLVDQEASTTVGLLNLRVVLIGLKHIS
jgi:hypothetical protein